MNLTEKAREAQRNYKRHWRQKNKDRIADYNRKYWENKASKMLVNEREQNDSKN